MEIHIDEYTSISVDRIWGKANAWLALHCIRNESEHDIVMQSQYFFVDYWRIWKFYAIRVPADLYERRAACKRRREWLFHRHTGCCLYPDIDDVR